MIKSLKRYLFCLDYPNIIGFCILLSFLKFAFCILFFIIGHIIIPPSFSDFLLSVPDNHFFFLIFTLFLYADSHFNSFIIFYFILTLAELFWIFLSHLYFILFINYIYLSIILHMNFLFYYLHSKYEIH